MRYPYLIYDLETFVWNKNQPILKSVDAFLWARNNQELDGSLSQSLAGN